MHRGPLTPAYRAPGYQIQYQAICCVRRISNCGASSCMMLALMKISRDARGTRRVDVRVRIAGASARFVCDIHVECLRRIQTSRNTCMPRIPRHMTIMKDVFARAFISVTFFPALRSDSDGRPVPYFHVSDPTLTVVGGHRHLAYCRHR